MYISPKASRLRQKEAQRARDNRAEIVRALSQGQITRRDLFRWGIYTGAGLLVAKNGLDPLARSAYAAVPTGTPRSPLYGAARFTQRMPRLETLQPVPMTRTPEGHAAFPSTMYERHAKRLSWHTDFNADPSNPDLRNPVTWRGPIEGRPHGEIFAHQRWDEFFPKAGYVLSIGQCGPGARFHTRFQEQKPDKVWTFGAGRFVQGELPPPLIKARYGEPMLVRIYNNLPRDRHDNGGFGRNELQTHLHNAHNGAESDGGANVHHFPGTFFDYRWSTTLARRDRINTQATDPRASGPDGNGGLVNVAGDFRELQSSCWFHDHRFFFTAENVYKGMLGAFNIYSGPDRGNEVLDDGINLRLPSGSLLDWGNLDFDVNLAVSDGATDQAGQYFFDIFNTDGFMGDIPLVNFAYAPFFEVLPRRYRFRILNACMSRYLKLGLFTSTGMSIPVTVIANDGNLLVRPVSVRATDIMGGGERMDIIVDFSRFRVGDRIRMANLLRMRDDGRGPKEELTLSEAQKRSTEDPVLGHIMEFRVVGSVASVDVPGVTHRTGSVDRSRVPAVLTEQVPILPPTRTRVIELGRSGSGSSLGPDGQCIPDCGEKTSFPWTIRINGESSHSMNANRISMLIPQPGDVEHWTFVSTGGGWDHPMHLHFEEGLTIARDVPMTACERLARKDVWRLPDGGQVTIQVQFGEYAGAYVSHCHNTVHEDFAMIMRFQLLGEPGSVHAGITPTPNPTEDGVFFTTPEILPEGDPRRRA
jgi:FtsP/CotA-like multicopper oxidase with cupredoxin domain